MDQLQQTASNILMIRPSNFGFNEETAANNSFQTKAKVLTPDQIKKRAMEEFDNFVAKMRGEGINIIVIEDTAEPVKPDAVFPNNWVTFHQDGVVITYPMYSEIRRHERRDDVLEKLKEDFKIEGTIRLEKFEAENRFLEGTGSMILDRVNKICYACTSPRTEEGLLDIFCELGHYQKAAFQSVDAEGEDIYHTNVMMALGEDFVVIGLSTIKDEAQKKMLLDLFEKTNKAVIDISFEQIMSFAGNMLQVRNEKGETYLVMSQQAYESLTEEQIKEIEIRTKILYSPIEAIETLGGGSARCMMAEVFLPKKN
ncbi:MAG: citrulline utilization hydrolase CtlX [Saprospiraceae bacterium]